MLIARSKRGAPIRLTEERWRYICEQRPELEGQQEKVLETVRDPDYVQKGDHGAKMAIRFYERTPLSSKHLIVVYSEIDRSNGFIITSYFTRKPADWREVLWRQ